MCGYGYVPSKSAIVVSCQNCDDQTHALLSDCPCAIQIVGAFEKDGQKLPHTLTGKWDTALEATMPDGSKQRIWTIHPMPAETTRYAAGAASHQSCTCSLWRACKHAFIRVASAQALTKQGSMLILFSKHQPGFRHILKLWSTVEARHPN